MRKRILVTGGAGFMGSHLAEYLLNEGHDVYVVDDLSGGYRDNVPKGAEFILLDLREKEKTATIIKRIKPEIIYHLAADAREGRSQFMPIDCNSRNLTAYLHLLVPAIRAGFDKIVVTSSMSVYGRQQPPFSEDLEPRPEDIYGQSKAAMETDTKVLANVHKFRYTILRPHNVYGPRQNLADPFRNVVAIFINCVLRGKQFYIYRDENGESCKRAFSYIDDVTPCVARAGFDSKCDGEIINVGPVEECSIDTLAELVLSVSGRKDLRPKSLPLRPQEVKDAWCTNEKAQRLLGYKTTITLEEGIKRMWKWAKSAGPKEPKYEEEFEIESPDLPRTWKERLI